MINRKSIHSFRLDENRIWLHKRKSKIKVDFFLLFLQWIQQTDQVLPSSVVDNFKGFISISLRLSCPKSHYIEVAQKGVTSRGRHGWLWIFSLLFTKKNQNKILSMRTLKKNTLKSRILYATIFFSTSNLPKNTQ